MTNRVEHVTIVGGGTAGWLTALSLITFLNERRDGPPVEVTLIESPNIPTVGVGEATVPDMPNRMRQLGIDEAEMFRRCNASFKMGVRFVDWNFDKSGKPIEFFHPFNPAPAIHGKNPAYHLLKYEPASGRTDFADSLLPHSALVHAHKGPRSIGAEQYDHDIGYSYHLDAALFAKFLRDVCITRGVHHVSDDVDEVEQDENGYITALTLKVGGRHAVEFVVDCTGFKGLIIQKTLGEPFESFADNLLCDKALAVQIPHEDPTRLEPCTRSTALGAGWVWRVPLYTRLGTGYVFSSAFRSDDEAIDEFLAHLGDQGRGVEPRVISMRVGRVRRNWVKNCVAIGLSGGFIEPLEATAIFAIAMSARWLGLHFPDKENSPALARRYNQLIAKMYDEIRNFIVLHYLTSNRGDPFWRAARDDIAVPDSLTEKLELWRHALPAISDTAGEYLFSFWSYLLVLGAKGHFDAGELPISGSIKGDDWREYCRTLANTKQAYLNRLPDHYELLTSIRTTVAEPLGR
jgi:tryptophan halogenase